MKKHVKKLQLTRETLSALTLEQNKLAPGMGPHTDTLGRCPFPATSDSVRACCV